MTDRRLTRIAPPAVLLAAVLLSPAVSGCGGAAGPQVMAAVPAGSAEAEAEITRVVEEALRRDAAWADGADLFAPQPTIVADGERRYTFPLFAAVDSGGQVAITSSRIEIGPTLAWAYVEYRWLSTARGAAAAGLATFVLAPARGQQPWSIVHVHSSTAP